MLDHWLAPVSTAIQPSTEEDTLGVHCAIHRTDHFPDLSAIQVALVGVRPEAADRIRQSLFPLQNAFPDLPLADLGNIRNDHQSFLIPVLKELLESGIIPVLIGAGVRDQVASFLAFQEVIRETSLVVVDERIHLSAQPANRPEYYLNDILYHPQQPPFHLGLIGYQLHYTASALRSVLDQRNIDHVRLGDARSRMSELEPLIRDADLLGFHLSSLRAAECSAVAHPTPSGFHTEEACRICRYAGMSDKLKSFGIYGYAPLQDTNGLSAQVVAQMLWYFLEGIAHRKRDFPASTAGLTEYIVQLKQLDYPLTFWKSEKSGRWWLQIPVKTRRAQERHRLIPCSYQDYQQAGRDELPDRLWRALRRFP